MASRYEKMVDTLESNYEAAPYERCEVREGKFTEILTDTGALIGSKELNQHEIDHLLFLLNRYEARLNNLFHTGS